MPTEIWSLQLRSGSAREEEEEGRWEGGRWEGGREGGSEEGRKGGRKEGRKENATLIKSIEGEKGFFGISESEPLASTASRIQYLTAITGFPSTVKRR